MKTKVYKFGGVSLKEAKSLDNIFNIINAEKSLVIVISAIDKTTNELEKLVDAYINGLDNKSDILNKIINYHINYVKTSFANLDYSHTIIKLEEIFNELRTKINTIEPSLDYDLEYDSIVSYGEILSSYIVNEYFLHKGLNSKFLDIREYILTDANYRDAKIEWQKSAERLNSLSSEQKDVYVTQGFIGRDELGNTTTLGREGSDYTASVLAFLLDAESVTIWKDVPGVMNADPAIYSFAQKLDTLSYSEAIELAFYGAKVIHPKTIRPLENKNIPLYVKSFINPKAEGTSIKNLDYKLKLIPIYILKEKQILISISSKDFSFIVEENLSKIFSLFAKYKVKVNIMKNSAISFSASIDCDMRKLDNLIKELQKDFIVKYNTDLKLVTIRFYDKESIDKMISGKTILMEQRNRTTIRLVLE